MSDNSSRWEQIYQQVPLLNVPQHFAGIRQSPFMLQYLGAILERCPRDGRALETGVGSGYGAIWLSLRGVCAEGIDNASAIVERAAQVNTVLGGKAVFKNGDLFSLYAERAGSPRYSVIFHQGVLEHFTMPQIRSAIAQQAALANWVIFSVPSVYYFAGEFGDERLLTLEVWAEILAPFNVDELRYYGDPQHGEKEHVLCILRGQEISDELLELMTAHEKPYPTGITGLVLARNEERNIRECLQSLQFCDELILVDMESEDSTADISRSCNARVLTHPVIHPFDRARNLGVTLASQSHVLVVDSDERCPPELADALRHVVIANGDDFEGMTLPFRHHFAGHWMQCLYPGYTAPRLFKNGKFVFNSRLHSGAQVQGRRAMFPADNPGKALVHFSFDSIQHYQKKQNSYTDGEAASMFRDGAAFDWRLMLRHALGDLVSYYDAGKAAQDGPYGLIYSLLSANYRLLQHAKLFEMRANAGLLQPQELEVPQSTGDMAAVMFSALRNAAEPPAPQAEAIAIADTEDAAEIVMSGPAFDRSGYAEEFRNALFGLDAAGILVRARSLPWSDHPDVMTESERERFEAMRARPAKPGFTHIIWDFPNGWQRDPNAGRTIVRTMHETDRFGEGWVQASHQADEIWAPTEFNRQTAIDSGIEPGKIRVIPGAFDFEEILSPFSMLGAGSKDAKTQREMPGKVPALPPLLGSLCPPEVRGMQGVGRNERLGEGRGEVDPTQHERSPYTFLSVFDWSRHKGWDVLITSFLKAFADRKDVRLVLKVWSTNGYTPEQVITQAQAHVFENLGVDLKCDNRVEFVFDILSRSELADLYKSCDCFVMPSRGEGWGRPYTEAMAIGLPVIGTNWSGNTAFMTDENAYLIDCDVQDVPESGWREIPAYKGHRWAEPNARHLQELMLRVVENPEEAASKGAIAREQVRARYSRAAVGKMMAEALLTNVQHPAPDCECRRGARPLPTKPSPQRLEPDRECRRGARPLPTKPSPFLTPSTLHSPSTQHPAPSPSHSPNTQHPTPILARWEGAFFNWHSLANVNRESCLLLAADPEIELSLVPVEPPQFGPQNAPRFSGVADLMFAQLPRRADIHIKHSYPLMLNRPDARAYVHMVAWEYGYLPRLWVEPLQENTDEIWVYSNYVREVCIESGIQEGKVKVIPLGVDSDRFRPGAPPYVITDEPGADRYHAMRAACKTEGCISNGASVNSLSNMALLKNRDRGQDDLFIFLIVGGLFARKGIDLLEEAYLKAFSAYDRVLLIAKNTGLNGPYRGSTEGERFRALSGDESRPAVVYLEHDIPEAQLAGLYSLADCIVLPYRGEGFCLPALEGMSSGKPVIVTDGGPTDDFVDETVGWRIKSRRKPCPPGPIGEWDCCGPAWMFEPEVSDLVRIMREAYQNREETLAKGKAARERVCAGWTWAHAVAKMKERMIALANRKDGCISKPEFTQEGNPATDDAASLPLLERHKRSWSPRVAEQLGRGGEGGGEVGVSKPEFTQEGNPATDDAVPADLVAAARGGAKSSKAKRKMQRSQPMQEPTSPPSRFPRAPSDERGSSAEGPHCSLRSLGEGVRLSDPPPPRLQLLSGVEIRDRRSAAAISPAETSRPNTQRPIPNTMGVPFVRRKRPTIALCMIMRDEERVLDACLTSVKPWFENIYIVDTGSVDNSVDIAKSHGAIVTHRPWDYSFSNARNASLDMARGEDYICWIDCDDVMPPECGDGLQRVIAMAEDRVTAYLMQVHIPAKPGENGFTIVDHVKVFRNNWPNESAPVRFIGRIHEQLMEPLYNAGGVIERTNLYVVHAGYDYSPEGQAKKRARDYTILALDEEERPSHPFPRFNYGMTYLHHEEYDLAIQKLHECLDRSKPHESTVRKVYAMLSGCYHAKHDLDSARAALDTGLALNPSDPELLFRSGNLYRELGDPAAAEGFYLRLLVNRQDSGQTDSLDVTMTTYKGRHNYALALTDLKRFDDAEAQLRTGLANNPTFAPSWQALGDLFIRRRRFEDVRCVLERLETLDSRLAVALRSNLESSQSMRVV